MAGDASMNDYEGFKVVLEQYRGGWRLKMTHLASNRTASRYKPTREQCEREMRDLALCLADPERWYATLGER
jgi:3'-phosphoadenosine 5'-phosphosulfate sulfotransferase